MPTSRWSVEDLAEPVRCAGVDLEGERCSHTCTTVNSTTPFHEETDESGDPQVVFSSHMPDGWVAATSVHPDPYVDANIAITKYYCGEHAPTHPTSSDGFPTVSKGG